MNRTQILALTALGISAIGAYAYVRNTEIVETEQTKRHLATLRWGWLVRGTAALGRLLSKWGPS